MHIRSVVVVNVALVGLLMLSAGCRAPWSKKAGAGSGAGLEDPTMIENTEGITDLSSITDSLGNLVSGMRYEELPAVEGVKFSPVYFSLDSYVLAPAEVSKVEQVAQHLMQNMSHVLVIEGHCDERGSNEYNLSLGENRAISVRTRLIDLGIAGDRIQTRSYGEEKPAVAGSGEQAWQLNRRGEFALYQK